MAAELRDKILFKQPESSHVGDCPICCLPLPLDRNGSAVMSCCSNIICDGCAYANQMREMEGDLQQKCPFCRQRLPNDDEEADLNTMKRVEANDPVATYEMGIKISTFRAYQAARDAETSPQRKAAAKADAA